MSAAPPGEGERIKVAVLGGGLGAMSAAWGLLQSKDADRYDITIYQKGWRLGGKSASGRNRAVADRIEQQGLHLWGGMYENAFRMMREVYAELDRPADAPLSCWYDRERPERSAFLPQNHLSLPEFEDGRWQSWHLELPTNTDLPGSGTAVLPRPTAAVEEILQMMVEAILGADFLSVLQTLESGPLPRWMRRLIDSAREFVLPAWATRLLDQAVHGVLSRLHLGDLEAALSAVRRLPGDPLAHEAEDLDAVLASLREFKLGFGRVFASLFEREAELRHLFVLLDLGTTIVSGLLRDRILQRGFDVVDDEDFASWLGRHGAAEATLESALVRGLYDFAFAAPDGQAGPRSLSAAVALRNLVRHVVTFKGSVFWRMQAGAGDVVFAPLYEVLNEHPNVQFRFFHEVQSLGIQRDEELTADIQTIEIARQVDLAPGRRHYDPLFDVKGLPCWPSEPLWDQLDPAQSRALQERGVDLENAWNGWEPCEVFELREGRDFDRVVFGIPPAAAAPITEELGRVHRPWREMLERLESVQTQSTTLWFDAPVAGKEGTHPPTLGSAYASPFSSWATGDALLAREDWSREDLAPSAVLTLCDTVADATPVAPFTDTDFPAREHRRSREDAVAWLMGNVGPIWPDLTRPGTAELDWSMLTTRHRELRGSHRFRDQYWHMGIDPSDRYVLSVPGSSGARLHAHESGFDNLYLAGDWLATGLDSGTAEAAVMGGFQASQAISGWPHLIPGDGDYLMGTDGVLTPRQGTGPTLELPRDDGVISGPLVQWWYWTGQLETAEGRRFGFEIVFFVIETFGDFVDATMGQAAVSDLDRDHFANEQFLQPWRPEEHPGRFDLQVVDSPIRATGGDGRDRLSTTVGDYTLELDVAASAPAVVHYGGQKHRYDFGGDTYYYSRPFMEGSGTIRTPEGETHSVKGDVWFDRQWGELAPAVLHGWQWFAIQLADATSIMLFAFNRSQSEWTGSITHPDGRTEILRAGQYQVEILEWWTSKRSGMHYPHRWKLTLPGYELEVRPEMDDQEMTASFWIGPRYWEGACNVTGSAKGRAYVELVGFSSNANSGGPHIDGPDGESQA